MRLHKAMILLSIASIVFLAGCTSNNTVSTASGVVITSFGPDIPEVDGGSSVTFTTLVQNIGERTATGLKIIFFGLSNEWDKNPATTTLDAFDSNEGAIATLAPADSNFGLKGEEGSIDITVGAPQGKSNDVIYDISTRVFYGYVTESDTLLRFVKSDYVKTNPNTPKGIVSHSSTDGPLSITSTARTPILGSSISKGRIQFEIQNTGNGRVYGSLGAANSPISLDTINKITITGIGTTGTCSGLGAGGTAEIPSVRLAGGKSKIISCDVDVGSIVNFADRAIKVKVDYNYFVDAVSHVTVLKSFDTGTVPIPVPQPSSTPSSTGASAAVQACQSEIANAPCNVGGNSPFAGICCTQDNSLTCVAKTAC